MPTDAGASSQPCSWGGSSFRATSTGEGKWLPAVPRRPFRRHRTSLSEKRLKVGAQSARLEQAANHRLVERLPAAVLLQRAGVLLLAQVGHVEAVKVGKEALKALVELAEVGRGRGWQYQKMRRRWR